MSATKVETLPTGYLKNGVFVSIQFITVRKGLHVRLPKQKLAQDFREFHDHMLPPAIRKKLGALYQRKYALYSRCCIKIESLKGYFCPNENFAEVASKAHEIHEDLKKILSDMIANREAINQRIGAFYRRYVGREPNGNELLPKDDERILTEYGRFDFDVRKIEIAGQEFLESHPEIKAKLKDDVLYEIQYNARKKEQQIRQEVLADVKPKVRDFLKFLVETKREMSSGKRIHGRRVKALEQRLKRIASICSVDEQMDTYVQIASGLAKSILETQKAKSKVLKPIILPAQVMRRVANIKVPMKTKFVEVKTEDYSRIFSSFAKGISAHEAIMKKEGFSKNEPNIDTALSDAFGELAKSLKV
jgi:hypothetical protein